MAIIEYIDGCEMNAAMDNFLGQNNPQNRPLAMAYVPYQEFEDLFSDEDALYRGTLYKRLDLPFLGRRNMR